MFSSGFLSKTKEIPDHWSVVLTFEWTRVRLFLVTRSRYNTRRLLDLFECFCCFYDRTKHLFMARFRNELAVQTCHNNSQLSQVKKFSWWIHDNALRTAPAIWTNSVLWFLPQISAKKCRKRLMKFLSMSENLRSCASISRQNISNTPEHKTLYAQGTSEPQTPPS